MSAPPIIRELVDRYRQQDRERFRSGKLTKAFLMQAYIEPLLGVLGWRSQYLVREGMRSPGRFHFDYLVAYGEGRWLGVEVKLPRVPTASLGHERARELVVRLRKAAWEAGLTFLVITNFEEMACYTCESPPKPHENISVARLFHLTFEEFENGWGQIASLLSKTALDPSEDMDSEEPSSDDPGEMEEFTWDEAPGVTDSLLDSSTHFRRVDWSLRVLHHKWAEDELYIPLGLERGLVWTQDEQSRLIESVLLRIPLPAFYLAEGHDGRLTVIDGQQRFLTLFRFIEGKWELRGLRLLAGLNGLGFRSLERRLQRRIEDTALTSFIVDAGADPAMKFEITLRLNPTWTDQDVRRVIHQGPGLQLVQELAKPGGAFRRLVHPLLAPDSKVEELALRMLTFIHLGPEGYTAPMSEFLTEALERLNRLSPRERMALRERALDALELVGDIFGGTAFRRFDPSRKKFMPVFNVTLLDIMPWGFVVESRAPDFWRARAGRLKQESLELQGDERFIEATAVNSPHQMLTRFKLWREMLQHVANSDA